MPIAFPRPIGLDAGVRALEEHERRALIAGRIVTFAQDADRPTGVEFFEIALAFPQESYVRDQQFGATANVITSRAVVEGAGKFCAAIGSGSDHEFGKRVHQAGFPVIYREEVVIRHPARRTLSELFAKTRRTVKGVRSHESAGNFKKGKFVRDLLKDLRPTRPNVPLSAARPTAWRLGGEDQSMRRHAAVAVLPSERTDRRAHVRMGRRPQNQPDLNHVAIIPIRTNPLVLCLCVSFSRNRCPVSGDAH